MEGIELNICFRIFNMEMYLKVIALDERSRELTLV